MNMDPSKSRWHHNLSLCYKGQGNLAAAEMESITSIAMEPGYTEGIFHLANIQKDMKRYDECFVNYAKAIQMQPKKANYHNNLGFAYFNANKFGMAKDSFLESARLNQKYPNPRSGLA
jgi:Tfp pilus assembly protein PilF